MNTLLTSDKIMHPVAMGWTGKNAKSCTPSMHACMHVHIDGTAVPSLKHQLAIKFKNEVARGGCFVEAN